MDGVLQQVLQGLASGSLYALLALALVLGYRATGVVNFAQGEMAMFTTFVAWALIGLGVPVLGAVVLAMGAGAISGALIERFLIRKVQVRGNEESAVILTIGLLLTINALAGVIWLYDPRAFPSMFASSVVEFSGVRLPMQTVGILATLAVLCALLFFFFQKTGLGLAMRAVASNPESSRLVGIRVGRMLMLGWAVAGGLGALTGALVAPQLFLHPNMMASVLAYALAAAALGGFDSPLGAVIGGLLVGVAENLVGVYVQAIGSDLKVLVPLALLVLILLARPQGLFGRKVTVRV
jgi:branched-chain amino acid transport system permease protein